MRESRTAGRNGPSLTPKFYRIYLPATTTQNDRNGLATRYTSATCEQGNAARPEEEKALPGTGGDRG
jgi:hypothetical protein